MDVIRNQILDSLPPASEWVYPHSENTLWDFRFANATLPCVDQSSLPNCDLKSDWKRLRVFGHSDSDIWYFYLCVDFETHEVVGLDPEKCPERGEKDEFVISSSINQFIDVFLLLNEDFSEGICPDLTKRDKIQSIENDRTLADWWLGWLD